MLPLLLVGVPSLAVLEDDTAKIYTAQDLPLLNVIPKTPRSLFTFPFPCPPLLLSLSVPLLNPRRCFLRFIAHYLLGSASKLPQMRSYIFMSHSALAGKGIIAEIWSLRIL